MIVKLLDEDGCTTIKEQSPCLWFVYVKTKKGRVVGYFSEAYAARNAACSAIDKLGKRAGYASAIYVTPAFHDGEVFRVRINEDMSGMSSVNVVA